METKHKSVILSCFSPAVMVATFVIEMTLALYVWLRYKATGANRAIVALLGLLATFQLSEYLICTTASPSLFWARVGHVAITLMPPVGLHLVSYATGRKHFLRLGYAVAALFIAYFIFVPNAIYSATCGGNYIIFDAPQFAYISFGIYYFAFLLLTIWEAMEKIFEIKKRTSNRKHILYSIIGGYLAFMLPMVIVYMAYSEARLAAASIMCGFALIMALTLAFRVAPAFHKRLS